MIEHPYITEAKELIGKLSKHCVRTMPNKEYSNLSKLPWKVMMFVNSMNWRMKESAEAAVLLLESDLTHPSLMLVRSCMENAAITIKLSDRVSTVVERKRVTPDDDEELMRLLFANNYPKDDPYLEPNDKRFQADRIGMHVTRADELYPGFKSYYKSLCEFVHPNSDGVGQSYSTPHFEEEYTNFHNDVFMYYTDPETRKPGVIRDVEMRSFILVTSADAGRNVRYFGADAPEYHTGDRVRVIDGIYKGAEGYIKRIKKDRKLIVTVTGVAVVAVSYIHPDFLEKID